MLEVEGEFLRQPVKKLLRVWHIGVVVNAEETVGDLLCIPKRKKKSGWVA